MKREAGFRKDSVDSIIKRLVKRQKRESPLNNRLQRTVGERLPRSMSTAPEIQSSRSLRWLL